MGFLNDLKHAWSAFQGTDDKSLARSTYVGYGSGSGLRPDRARLNISNERSIIASIYTRLAVDVSSVSIRHVRVDENGRYVSDIDSNFNNCLKVEANIDQAGTAFRQDIATTLFDRGVAAIVPVDTSADPNITGGYDINSLRVGQILTWYPQHVRVSVYNEKVGRRQEIVVPKSIVAIVENPLYSVMNEPNSTLQRLIRKLNLLDAIDEQSGSGKLDLIIQLPYVIKTEERRLQAEKRRKDVEDQLKGSQYGIAYTDGTEHITQLNRPSENNMLAQITYLTNMLYGQLGLTEAVFDGTADEKTMLNYYNRTVDPILTAISEAMKRTFLTKTARSQNQSVEYLRDPFKLVPVADLAELADKFTRNEILSSNEVRGIIGMAPSNDPSADELRNKNIPEATPPDTPPQVQPVPMTATKVDPTSQPLAIEK